MRRTRSESRPARPTTHHDRVLAVVQENAASLLRLARRHSLCADDAHDAYQRALEIYLRRIDDVDDATAGAWLRTVVKHEAMAVRESRQRILSDEGVDFDTWAAPEGDGERRAVSFERLERAAEALRQCKADQVSAMALKAEGHSYAEISALTGWSYTKVNRCLAEGRKQFLDTFAAIESGAECDRLAPALSAIADGEATAQDFDAARPHLRNCPGCRAMLRELVEAQPAIHAVLPATLLVTPAVAETGAGLLGRAWEVVFGGVQDRVAVAAVKVQTTVETVSATKVAAVAASAAAVAGGGAVAVDGVAVERRADEKRPVKAVVRVSDGPAQPARVAPVSERPVVTVPEPTATPRPAGEPAEPAPDPPSQPTAPPKPEFGFEAAAPAPEPPAQTAASSGPTAPAPAPAASRRSRTESFGFER